MRKIKKTERRVSRVLSCEAYHTGVAGLAIEDSGVCQEAKLQCGKTGKVGMEAQLCEPTLRQLQMLYVFFPL